MPADSLLKARTPEPTGHGGRNWLTRLKPGNKGEQPAYIQHIVHALMTKRGMPQAEAEAIAVSAPKRWLKSRHADAGTKAASALAVGQWEKDRALSRLHKAGKAVATTAAEVPVTVSDTAAICEQETEVLASIEESLGADVLEAAIGRVQWADYLPLSPREHMLDELAERAAVALTLVEATRTTREIGSGRYTNYLKKISRAPGAGPCANCGALKLPDKMCPACEAPMAGKKAASLAEAAVLVVQERDINQAKREALLAKGQAIKNPDGSIAYPVETPADLKAAAVLAKSKHGDYKKGGALVSKMAKKWGVKDPMQESVPGHFDAKHPPKVGDHVEYKHPNGQGHTFGRVDRLTGGNAHIKSLNGPVHKVPVEHVLGKWSGKIKEGDDLQEKELAAFEHTTAARSALRRQKGKAEFDKHIKAAHAALPASHPAHSPLNRAKLEMGRSGQQEAWKHLKRAREMMQEGLHEAEIDGAKPTPHTGTLARVKAMNLGDTVRLPSGHAITHAATPDGRKVWRADSPARWSGSGWSLGDDKRTPEAAVKDAFRLSAASNDPASLGGAQRYHTYSRVKVGGREQRFVGVDAHSAKPEVRDLAGLHQPASIKVVGWDELHPVDDIMQQGDTGGVLGGMLDGRLEEAAKARRDTIGAIAGKGGPKDTFDFHAKGGKFTKGRAQIHGGMIRHVLDNPKAQDSGPVAMVATRSPSGGAVETVKGAGSSIPHDAIHVSIPAMRERIPEHAALSAHAGTDESATTDREARHVAKLASTMALMRGKSVVVHDDPIQEQDALLSIGARAAAAMRRAAAGL